MGDGQSLEELLAQAAKEYNDLTDSLIEARKLEKGEGHAGDNPLALSKSPQELRDDRERLEAEVAAAYRRYVSLQGGVPTDVAPPGIAFAPRDDDVPTAVPQPDLGPGRHDDDGVPTAVPPPQLGATGLGDASGQASGVQGPGVQTQAPGSGAGTAPPPDLSRLSREELEDLLQIAEGDARRAIVNRLNHLEALDDLDRTGREQDAREVARLLAEDTRPSLASEGAGTIDAPTVDAVHRDDDFRTEVDDASGATVVAPAAHVTKKAGPVKKAAKKVAAPPIVDGPSGSSTGPRSVNPKVLIGAGVALVVIVVIVVVALSGGSSKSSVRADANVVPGNQSSSRVAVTPVTPTPRAAVEQIVWNDDNHIASQSGCNFVISHTIRITNGAKFAGKPAVVVFFGQDYKTHPQQTFTVGPDGSFTFDQTNGPCLTDPNDINNQTGVALVSVDGNKNVIPPTDAVVPH